MVDNTRDDFVVNGESTSFGVVERIGGIGERTGEVSCGLFVSGDSESLGIGDDRVSSEGTLGMGEEGLGEGLGGTEILEVSG